MTRRIISRILRDDQGQDLTEYTLLIAMVALAAFAIFISTGKTAAQVWKEAGATITSARVAATATGAPNPTDHGGH